jgi:RNA polymerase sigma-70 factor (ECF subfamily)
MFAVCRRYAGNREDASDFMQEAFIRVFQNLKQFGFNGSLEGWIRRIVVTTCINELRKRKLTMDIDDMPEVQTPHTSIHDGMNELEMQELMSLIQGLPAGYRTVFNLFAIEGYDHAEIAGMLGITESTSRSQLVKARRWLKENYERNYKISVYASNG